MLPEGKKPERRPRGRGRGRGRDRGRGRGRGRGQATPPEPEEEDQQNLPGSIGDNHNKSGRATAERDRERDQEREGEREAATHGYKEDTKGLVTDKADPRSYIHVVVLVRYLPVSDAG